MIDSFKKSTSKIAVANGGKKMVRKRNGLLVWVLVLMLLPFSVLDASEEETKVTEIHKRPLRLSIEYFYPSEESRDIRTINLNAYYLIKEIKSVNLSIYAGITASYGDGDITQLEGDLNAGTIREVNFDSEAVGIGPGILADLRLLQRNKISLHLDGSGSIIFYNKEFPAGGEYYNFMWRVGPVLRYAVGSRLQLGLGYRWMHVSNGQGIGPSNQSYDARGPGLEFSIPF